MMDSLGITEPQIFHFAVFVIGVVTMMGVYDIRKNLEAILVTLHRQRN